MKKLFFLCSLLFSVTITPAQTKPKPSAKAPVGAMQKLLAGTGLPFTIVSDSLAVIPYEGRNIASYQVLVQKVNDLYIIYCNLTEALPGKIDETKFKYLLEQNDHFDVVKIGLGNDNTAYVRADLYRSTLNTTLLLRIIKQVANVTNIIAGDLK